MLSILPTPLYVSIVEFSGYDTNLLFVSKNFKKATEIVRDRFIQFYKDETKYPGLYHYTYSLFGSFETRMTWRMVSYVHLFIKEAQSSFTSINKLTKKISYNLHDSEIQAAKSATLDYQLFVEGIQKNLNLVNRPLANIIDIKTWLKENKAALVSIENFSLNSDSKFTKKIGVLPLEIELLINLRKFSIIKHNLCNLPESICTLVKLENLILSNNQIRRLPHRIGHLTNLKVLDVSGNYLNTLPESIGSLIKLSFLGLKDNNLESLPDSLCFLTNLKTLNIGSNDPLRRNCLYALPKEFGSLTNLTDLNLSSNPLKTIPASFANLNLIRLNVDGCVFNEVPEEIYHSENSVILDNIKTFQKCTIL